MIARTIFTLLSFLITVPLLANADAVERLHRDISLLDPDSKEAYYARVLGLDFHEYDLLRALNEEQRWLALKTFGRRGQDMIRLSDLVWACDEHTTCFGLYEEFLRRQRAYHDRDCVPHAPVP